MSMCYHHESLSNVVIGRFSVFMALWSQRGLQAPEMLSSVFNLRHFILRHFGNSVEDVSTSLQVSLLFY